MQTKAVLVPAPNTSERSEQHTLGGLKEAEVALADPLKEETRKARLYLLGVSMVSIAIVWTGLVPQEISTLGITFGQANRQALLLILALVVFYFLLAFAIYGASDYLGTRYAFVNVVWSERVAESGKQHEKHRKEVEEAKAKFKEARRRKKELEAELEKARRAAKSAQQEFDATRATVEKKGRVLDIDMLEKQFLEPSKRPVMLSSEFLSERSKEQQDASIVKYADEDKIHVERAYAHLREAKKAVEKSEPDVEDAAYDAVRAEKEVELLDKRGPGGGYKLSLSASKEEAKALEMAQVIERYSTLAPYVSLTRRIFEFLLPLFVGVYAIYALLSA